MILKSLEVANFRKFRDPLRIDGLTDGLNIIVEPNETGKSTLLEALRAAFFVRYSAKTDLVRSYVPIGDDVAPRVKVCFELKSQTWTLEKQFLKSPSVRLTGSSGRRESDAAEEALQELLGFERGNNRGGDLETRGPLGMLWMEQAGALVVESPNRIVRDSVLGVLEAEVGAVTGGRRFDAIRTRIETAYSALRTATTGKSRGDLAAAEVRVAEASAAREQAEVTFRAYEEALTELDTAKSQLKILERDLVDPEMMAKRKKLEKDEKIAEGAAARLTAADAQFGHAEEVAKTASSRMDTLDAAEARVKAASARFALKQAARDEALTASILAGKEEKLLRGVLDASRVKREKHETVLTNALERARAFSKAAGARRAIDARNALSGWEDHEKILLAETATAIDKEDLDRLEQLERAAIEAKARFEAGTVKVDVELANGVTLRVNGKKSDVSSIDVFTATRLEIGDAGSIVVRPPQGSGQSVEADCAAATDEVVTALRSLAISSYSAGAARNDRATAAVRELKALRTQIAAACPGDPTIDLAPGADALRAHVAGLGDKAADAVVPTDDLEALTTALSDAKLAEVTAAGKHDVSRAALSKAESTFGIAEAGLVSASEESEAAAADLQTLIANGDRDAIKAAFDDAKRERTVKFEALEAAREGAEALDVDIIRSGIENLNRANKRAGEEQLRLTGRIASLESTIEREGPLGPAGRKDETSEEEDAAIAACARLRRQADILEMLRKALSDAANEATQTFLGPVTKRAARYIQKLLPGCDLSFDDDLGLAAVKRGGIDESCSNLSRGTQEQLAILTRLAFADLLLEDGAPISVILDDPLVYSDDARLETMTDILQESASRMQVILLTCRSRAFRHVEANHILLR